MNKQKIKSKKRTKRYQLSELIEVLKSSEVSKYYLDVNRFSIYRTNKHYLMADIRLIIVEILKVPFSKQRFWTWAQILNFPRSDDTLLLNQDDALAFLDKAVEFKVKKLLGIPLNVSTSTEVRYYKSSDIREISSRILSSAIADSKEIYTIDLSIKEVA